MADDVATVGRFFSDGDVGGVRQFRSIVNAIDDGLYQLDPRGHFVAVNDVIAEVTGYGREELLGRHVSVVLDNAEVERVETAIRGLLGSDPDTATLNLTVETADGEAVPCELRLNLLVEDGEFRGTVGVVRDVSDRKERERALAEAEQRFRSLVDAVEEYAIFMLDPGGCVVSWNEGARRLNGYEREEIIGEHFSTFYTERDREASVPEENLAAAREDGSTEDEGWRVRADGSRFWADATIRTIRDDDGGLQGYAKVVRDMTERRRVEAERELLYETTRSIAEAETFADGLRAALRRICTATDWEFGEAWIPTDGGVLRRADAEYYEPDLAPFSSFSESFAFERGEGMPGRVWASGDYEWAADLQTGSPERYPRIEEAREVGMESVLGVPIAADGEVEAVLTFATRELREPDERAIELVSSVAAKLGDLVRRRRAEQAHRREQELTEQVLETSPVGIAVFSAEGSVERFNDRMNDVLQLSGESFRAHAPGTLDLRGPDDDPLAVDERPVGRAIETGEPVIGQEVRIETDDGRTRWVSVNATPITDEGGDLERVVATAIDVTRLKSQARRLQRQRDDLESELDEVFERIDDAFYALDDEFRFTYVNEQAETLLGRDAAELTGETVWEVYPGTADTCVSQNLRRAMETQEPTTFEYRIDCLETWIEGNVYPSETGLSVYFRDVTERKERERELEEYRRWNRTLVENLPSGAVALVDEDFRYVTFAGTPAGDADVTRADLEGEHVRDVLPQEIAEVVVPRYEAALAGEPSEFEDAIDGRVYQFHFVPVRDDDGDVFAATAMSQDVTERKEREQALEQYRSLTQAASDVIVTIDEDSEIRSINPAVEDVFGYDREQLLGGSLTALMPEEFAGEHRAGIETYLRTGERSIDWDYVELPGERADGTEIPLAISFNDAEYGGQRYFTGIVRDVSERKERERELERQRERLAALNSLHEVVQDVTDAAVEQSTREEIEEIVCERLANSDSYRFAWIGDVDPRTETVRLRTEAGVEGYLDGVTISTDPDDERSQGPTGRAVRTGEIQTTRDVREDPRHEPWREHCEEHGFRSSAAIPIVHDGTQYGVLNVYADRPAAFTGEEREVIGLLGEIVGHAIASVERKRALLCDEVVELDLMIEGVLAEADPDERPDAPVRFDQVVPVGGEEYLGYGTVNEADVEALRALVDVVDHWKSVRVVREGYDRVTFELHAVEPPLMTTIAGRGGSIQEARLEGSDIYLTVQLPQDVDTRTVVDDASELYPGLTLRAQRQVTRMDDGPSRVAAAFGEELTDRQRAAVEAAYFAGYFDWPRESSGQEVATSLDISAATFSQHLRTAERRIFEALFEDPTGEDDQ